MKTLKIVLVFISFYIIRIWLYPGVKLVEGQRVKLTIPTIDFAEYTDSKTIVRRGSWEVMINGYTNFIPGDVLSVEGVWDGRRIRSDTVSQCQEERCKNISLVDKLLIGISYVRRWAVERLQRVLPEPMASLASGILLGVKAQMPYDFYQKLVSTGTLHVIAASGFNVMIVAQVLMAGLGRLLGKRVGIIWGVIGIILYVLLAGASASVVRAGIMGSLTLIAFYFGRVAEARRLLWITAAIMLLAHPDMLGDIGFQLSMAATFGMLYLEPVVRERFMIHDLRIKWGHDFLKEFFYPTLAATIATAPVIWWHFGRLSLIGVFANMLILPVVPLIMLLAAITLIVTPIAYLLYAPLWWVVAVIELLG